MSPQQTIAHYYVTTKLGQGGMGEVWRATDTKLGRDVAVKILPDAFAQDAHRMARFAREAQILASLNHPNIAAIYGVEERALVLELVEGPTLADRIAQGPMSCSEALGLLQQLTEALEYAHEKGVIHRDLKPANLKVTADGRLKVLDFGLAKALGTAAAPAHDPLSSPTLTIQNSTAGAIVGTAAYMPPEQARGQAVDKRADIWAMGVVLWEMLTGRRMFEGATITDVLAAVLKNEPDLEAVPASVRPLIAACLEKDPRKRLRDAGDWRRLVVDDAHAAPPRAGWWPWAAAALGLAAGAGLGVLLRPTPKTAAPLVHVIEDPPVELAKAGHAPAIALATDGTRIVYRVQPGDSQPHLSIRQLDQPTPRDLPGTEGADGVFFSSDGRSLGFVNAEGFFKLPVDGGAPTLLFKAASGIRGVAWASDGTVIYGSLRGPLFRVPAKGGDPVPLTKLEKGEITHRWPARSPVGNVIVFAASRSGGSYDEAELAALSLRTGERTLIHNGGTFPRFLPTGDLLFIRAGTLYILPLDRNLQAAGTPRAVLSDIASVLSTGGSHFTMSDTGTAAYIPGWVDEARSLLTWISAEGKLSAMAPPAAYIGPRLSPDCKKVAVRVDSPNGPDFHVWDIERGVLTRVTFDARTKSPVTVWTPDGRFLVYGAEVAGLGIYAVPSDGSAPPRKILETAAETEPESFSPDGKWLLLSEQGKISSAPVEIRNDGLQLGKPTGFAVTGAYPRFSPDGRWVVYGSYESGISQIFARRFPNAGAKYQISRAGGINPVWPRGKQLFFLSSQGIMGVNCAAQDESLHCDTPRLWSDQQMTSRNAVPTFDVAADGRVLALTPPLEAGSGRMRVHFLFNFGANAIHSQ